MATWQNNTLSPGETLLWLKSLPSEIQTNQPTTLLIAESLVLTKDWAKLQEWLQPQRWNELEFVKQAFLSRALRGQDLDAASKASWELAVKATGQQKQALIMLFRLAAQWRWISEGEDVLWSIVNSYPDEKWAVQALSQALIVGGRTRPLMALFNQQVKAGVNDLAVKNNLAMTAFLLEAKERKPHDLAEEVYTKAPTNASFASTYAFSLYLQNKPAEALKVMQTLRQEQVSDPSVAGYYGLVLKANGDKNRARAYLERAYKAPLLPEEKRLFDAAKVGI
jgi:tetratricopeptide (TPR) repeat protein